MKKVLLLIMLTIALFSYDNYPYYNPNPDVESLYCKATSAFISGTMIIVNDRNRKEMGVYAYMRYIKTRSWMYIVGKPNNRWLFSHTSYDGPGRQLETYINTKNRSTITVVRHSEYGYILTAFPKSIQGRLNYYCTTNP